MASFSALSRSPRCMALPSRRQCHFAVFTFLVSAGGSGSLRKKQEDRAGAGQAKLTIILAYAEGHASRRGGQGSRGRLAGRRGPCQRCHLRPGERAAGGPLV